MKRHPILIPISREHHQMLLLAQLLKKDAPPYQALPQDPIGKKKYALDLFNSLIFAHLQKDSSILYPFLSSSHSDLLPLTDELSQQASQLCATFQSLESAENDLPGQLDTLGRSLEAYVRKKERQLFELAQWLLDERSFEFLNKKLNE
ncbi:MAG: hypothetical protein ACLFUB_18205 [Cyclobacteriaceae bacterium]